MKLLLTGGLGFIGKNFLIHRPKEWQITCLDQIEDKKFQKQILKTRFYRIDLAETSEIKKLASKIEDSFDACLILAANGDPALSVPDVLWDLRSTTQTVINTLDAFKIKKVIYLSSGAVYNGAEGLISPKNEVRPNLPYAISHLASEWYVRAYKEVKDKIDDYLVIRFFGAYGPYEPPRKIYTKLAKSFGLEGENNFSLRGNGENFIDAMYVEDAVKGLVAAINSQRSNFTVDFCKGEHPSVNDLVKQAGKIFNVKVKISHEGDVPEYNRFYASNTQFKKSFNFEPRVTLKQGLESLAAYYRQTK